MNGVGSDANWVCLADLFKKTIQIRSSFFLKSLLFAKKGLLFGRKLKKITQQSGNNFEEKTISVDVIDDLSS